MRFADVVDRWVCPTPSTTYGELLHRAELGQRLVGALAVSHLVVLRDRPRWPCVAATVRRLLERGLTGNWALATRLALTLEQPGDGLHPWVALAAAPAAGIRGVNGWLTASEICLRHFDRLPPAAVIARATRRLGEELIGLCARLGRASDGLALHGEGPDTELVFCGGTASLAPLLERAGDTLRVWDGMTHRRRGRGLLLVEHRADGNGQTWHEENREYPWPEKPVFRGLAVPSGGHPLAAYVSERPYAAGDDVLCSEVVADEDPAERAEDLGSACRTAYRPVIVLPLTPWESPLETVLLSLGLDERVGPEQLRQMFVRWVEARGGTPAAVPILILAGADVRPGHVEALESVFAGRADLCLVRFVTGTASYDLHWPNHSRIRYRVRPHTAVGGAAPDPLPVRALKEAGAATVDAWRDGAVHAFQLDPTVLDRAGLDRLVAVTGGRGDILAEPLASQWLRDGYAAVRPDGTLAFLHDGWRDLWAGVAGFPVDGNAPPSPAWEAGRRLREEWGRDG